MFCCRHCVLQQARGHAETGQLQRHQEGQQIRRTEIHRSVHVSSLTILYEKKRS
jgi:hypothetical protein